MVNAQEWLDQNYSQEQRENVKSLDLRGKGAPYYTFYLSGHLVNLQSFVNLTSISIDKSGIVGNLEVFAHLFNLKVLLISIYDSWSGLNNQWDKFSGSLSAFKKLEKLEEVYISGQRGITEGVFPTDNLKRFECYQSGSLWEKLNVFSVN